MRNRTVAFAVLVLAAALAALTTSAQVPEPVRLDKPFSCTIPVNQRGQEMGCYILATPVLDKLPTGPLYWHLYTFASREAAEGAQGGPTGTVVESFSKIWLFKIAARSWHPRGGERVAAIGPLAVQPAKKYVARYMESVEPTTGGTPVHRHPGPEAWYILSGAQCLQIPGKTFIARAGDTPFVPGGMPMALSGAGNQTRRSLVLVLHDASLNWRQRANDWKPAIACPK